ncbi:hypothetical protein AA0311_0398 [Asaia bogorensis NBRC 16594]|nr:hypothetical protein AA0311_0398 [Asaia bogorensis NBRC 16594]
MPYGVILGEGRHKPDDRPRTPRQNLRYETRRAGAKPLIMSLPQKLMHSPSTQPTLERLVNGSHARL